MLKRGWSRVDVIYASLELYEVSTARRKVIYV
jgi:hypothetical protein